MINSWTSARGFTAMRMVRLAWFSETVSLASCAFESMAVWMSRRTSVDETSQYWRKMSNSLETGKPFFTWHR